MQVNVPVNLRIVPKVKQSGDKKILAGIESFMLGIPLIIKELEKRTECWDTKKWRWHDLFETY